MGQTSSEVQWLARGPRYTLFLAGYDAVLEVNKIVPGKRGAIYPAEMKPGISSSAVRMNLLGAKTIHAATGEDPQSGKANYFTGNDPSKWQRNVPLYGKVLLRGVYPGIDLVYYGRQGQLEYDFVVAPGADPAAIRWGFDGAMPEIAANGDLLLPVSGASDQIRLNKPVVYQVKDGVHQPVEGSFAVAKNGEASFRLGAYDKSRELVIDPTLIFRGALDSGAYDSVASGMALDTTINSQTGLPNNQIILTGYTQDATFPVTTGALQTTCNTDAPADNGMPYTRCGVSYAQSAFVTKISADGSSLVYSTYLHGLSGNESGQAVAVNSQGYAVVLGATSSNDFPITTCPQTGTCNVQPAFQTLCQPLYNGTTMVPICDGFFSGGGTEYTVNGPNLFIVKLDPTGSTLEYGTFLGGTASVYPAALALDSSDNIYVAGWVQAAWPSDSVYPGNGNQNIQFPVTSGGYQTVGLNGSQAASLSVLSADGQTLLYSTFMSSLNQNASSPWAQPLAIAAGQNGIAAIGGVTLASSFPTTPGSVRPACVVNPGNTSVCYDYTGWVSVFDTTQSGDSSLVYSTFIGGDEVQGSNASQNQVQGLAFDSSNDLFVTGFTSLSTYPTTPGVYQPHCTGCTAGQAGLQSAFLSKIDPTGSTYLWSTYFGASRGYSATYGDAIAFDSRGWVYLYGYNNGYGWDLPVVNPVEPLDGNNMAYVAVFSADASQLIFSTPITSAPPTTGAWDDEAIGNNGVALDSNNNIYIAAYGNDGGKLVPTTGAYDTPSLSNNYRTYFAEISKVTGPVATTLAISPSPALPGSNITFTASVAGTAGNTPLPTGTVTLTNGDTTPPTTLGIITLGSNASGTFSTRSLSRGQYSVVANYSGDSNYETGSSTAQTLTVNQLQPKLTVTPSASTVLRIDGLTVTVTAGGGSGNPVPTGTITLSSGSYSSSPAPLSAGVARIDIPKNVLPDGTITLLATYTPDAGSIETYRTSTGTVIVKVERTTQTIHFTAPPATETYGAKPIKLSATATSGLGVTFTVVSGHGKISGDELTITGAGDLEIAAGQSGNASFKAAEPVTHRIVVDKAPLTVKANNLTMKQGSKVPTLTWSFVGFVNHDTASDATTGKPKLSTRATSASAPGSYPIDISAGTLAAKNYDLKKYVDGTMTVTQ